MLRDQMAMAKPKVMESAYLEGDGLDDFLFCGGVRDFLLPLGEQGFEGEKIGSIFRNQNGLRVSPPAATAKINRSGGGNADLPEKEQILKLPFRGRNAANGAGRISC